jgi:kynurenine formamidase
VIEGREYTDEIPLYKYFGPGVVLSIPKTEDWAPITREDLEKATPKIQAGDLVIINCGWHKYYGDNQKYFAYSPGLVPSAIEYLLEVGAKGVGVDPQALDHPLATAIGNHGPGPLLPGVVKEYEKRKGHAIEEDFPDWEPCHRLVLGNGMVGFENVCGADIDKVTGKRVIIAAFPIRWEKGDGSIVRVVAMVDPSGEFRIPTGKE